MSLTDTEKKDISEKIVTILSNTGKEGASCGDIIEILCNVLGSSACWLSDSLDVPRGEIVADITSIVLEGLRKIPKEESNDE